MIRFVDLGHQLGIDDSWPRGFAFFSTVCDQFLTFSGAQDWICWEDFGKDYLGEHLTEIERFRSVCPEWVFTAKSWSEVEK